MPKNACNREVYQTVENIFFMELKFTLKEAAIRNSEANHRPMFIIVFRTVPTFTANQRPVFKVISLYGTKKILTIPDQ